MLNVVMNGIQNPNLWSEQKNPVNCPKCSRNLRTTESFQERNWFLITNYSQNLKMLIHMLN